MSKKTVTQKFTRRDVDIVEAFKGVEGPLTFKQINERLAILGYDPINSGNLNSAKKKGIIDAGEEVMQTVVSKSKVTAYKLVNENVDLVAAKCSEGVQEVAHVIADNGGFVDEEDGSDLFTSSDVSLALGKKVAPAHLTNLCAVGFLEKAEEKIVVSRLREEPAKSYVLVNADVVEGAVVPTSVALEVEEN